MHWPWSTGGVAAFEMRCAMERSRMGCKGCWKVGSHGEDLSERRTPRSRASCSRVMGMKDPAQCKTSQPSIIVTQSKASIPTPQITKTSAAHP